MWQNAWPALVLLALMVGIAWALKWARGRMPGRGAAKVGIHGATDTGASSPASPPVKVPVRLNPTRPLLPPASMCSPRSSPNVKGAAHEQP